MSNSPSSHLPIPFATKRPLWKTVSIYTHFLKQISDKSDYESTDPKFISIITKIDSYFCMIWAQTHSKKKIKKNFDAFITACISDQAIADIGIIPDHLKTKCMDHCWNIFKLIYINIDIIL